MEHQNRLRISGRVKEPILGFILQTMLQAEQDGASQLVFARSCRDVEGELGWIQAGQHCSIQTPSGITGRQIREALMDMTGLDRFTEFPKESSVVLEIPASEFIQEFEVDEKYRTAENEGWRQIGWRVSVSTPDGPITLVRS